MTAPLTPAELDSGLEKLPDWRVAEGQLVRELKFPSFVAAVGYMNEMVPRIDAMNHHPEWTNVYNTVTVRLSTHDADGAITAQDLELARLLDLGLQASNQS
ncbi:MAG: 4a-hydroxytetrahydrobiopterin dehydratase [Actinomycetia bacterium]|nr:4a-hydroxytetrahydrobiopterin dehydratase [Actinomycetes bacterium]